MQLRSSLVSMFVVASLAACGGKAKGSEPATSTATSESASLYDRLGRRDAIALVVKDFVEQRVAMDARINRQFASADLPGLQAKLVDQICEVTGGPCKYTGKDMRSAHTGMHITDADFKALVEDLKASLDHFKVGAREQEELLGALAAMRDDIVTAK